MNYWRGRMNWPMDTDWKCETCDSNCGLEWGLVHAECRCNLCHTQYTMRADDEQGTILSKPMSKLRPEYELPARLAYVKYQKPIDELTDEDWDSVLARR